MAGDEDAVYLVDLGYYVGVEAFQGILCEVIERGEELAVGSFRGGGSKCIDYAMQWISTAI